MSLAWTELKPGDIITAYSDGWHVVTKVEQRQVTKEDKDRFSSVFHDKEVGDERAPLIHYRTVLTSKLGKTKSNKVQVCDASYCEKWTKERIEQYRQANIKSINEGCDILLNELQ